MADTIETSEKIPGGAVCRGEQASIIKRRVDMDTEKEARKKYDFMSDAYHDMRTKSNPRGWFFNEFLEMPATLKLLGNIKGKKVLDFGCGTGIYAKIMAKAGAKVKGFDISGKMLEIARKGNPGLELRRGSGSRIPFDEKFDIVVAALVLDCVRDWGKALREVSRVLKKGGYFVFSAGNPIIEVAAKTVKNKTSLRVIGEKSYFREGLCRSSWGVIKGKEVIMPFYHKTYETIIKRIIKSGFEIVDYADCKPSVKAKKLFPEYYKSHSIFPIFCVWKIRKA